MSIETVTHRCLNPSNVSPLDTALSLTYAAYALLRRARYECRKYAQIAAFATKLKSNRPTNRPRDRPFTLRPSETIEHNFLAHKHQTL